MAVKNTYTFFSIKSILTIFLLITSCAAFAQTDISKVSVVEKYVVGYNDVTKMKFIDNDFLYKEGWQTLAQPNSNTNVLLVTSQIYVPFQEFDALRLISRNSGAVIEVVGIPPPAEADPSHLLHKPENYLQEIRSAILSAQRLLLSL